MSETNELAKKLARRNMINEGEEVEPQRRSMQVFNPYTEFEEFTRKRIRDFEMVFKKYDVNKDNFLDLNEMKLMMEKLNAPQTHIGLKGMIKEVDEDNDNCVSFREFLLIFRKAAAGELQEGTGLFALAELAEVDVDEVGVGGAANFFEAKIRKASGLSKYEMEVKEEQEERKREAELAKERKQQFKAKQSAFAAPS